MHGADGLEEGKSTLLKKGTIVSNWDGKNLDPCSVKRHNSQLRRAGFMNNVSWNFCLSYIIQISNMYLSLN